MKKEIDNFFLTILTVLITVIALSTLARAASVNSYISAHHYSPATITKQIWKGFPRYRYRHGKGKPEGVVIHETGNPSSTIFDEIAYMKKNYRNAFVHSFVDSNHIINIANTDYLCWGVGYPGNARFLQFEQTEMHSKKSFAHEVENAAYYTAYLLKSYHLKPNDAVYDGKGTVWSHGAVAKYLGGSDHTDPVGYYKRAGRKYFHKAYTMNQFYKLVLTNYDDM
ncbi:N-acetylmuramoyl-L-alanine amidase family protein [Lentilactobacillus farraginis]|uniref:Internalin B n=1 Tax=Lentilactobacillus farraginis DSM 18382 = JCM 14108 TaxID=1423743 RepID=X0PAE5_9LACO|nr:N-acetylmuramoyl-L-alanine amidase [Lentilactobacillus farraginis]KRM10964.1 N-acetylmuramoyl-L-alanine amidase [Lentilactobacillus farraginis DSM 18382 = JCM 14108]GAF36318.1 internalin B [Lentilactobacillus farraginis DSM 18382 = JCM 14108]